MRRRRSANVLLAVLVTLLAYLAAEAAFTLVGLHYVPLRLHGDLPEDIRIFVQSSKAGVLPRELVLLLGDSYAQGYGDWLLGADPDRNGPYASAHVIQARSGRDVVSLGLSGAGSVEALALLPSVTYAASRRAWYLRLPAPRIVVVYFYEGNDLNDNLRFLRQHSDAADGTDFPTRLDRALAIYAASPVLPRDRWQALPLLRFLARVGQRRYAELTGAALPVSDVYGVSPATTGPPNVVEVAGRPVGLPANLQSPALELSEPELADTVLVFERSVAYLRRLLPDSSVLVVYLPSPLSSYRLLGSEVSIQSYLDREIRYPGARVPVASNRICRLIRAASIGQGGGFLDVRPAIRTVTAHQPVHGPRDFKHFNPPGMEALGAAVAARLAQPLATEPCAELVY
jgi:hypothetical protein